MKPPIVFISYSHDNPAHKEWVLKLASDLRANGVDAMLDQWDLTAGQDVAAFMAARITTSDRVLLICTEEYVERAESGSGGVGYERLVLTAEIVQNIDTKKFIPLMRVNAGPKKVPAFLGLRLYIDFSKDEDYDARFEELLRELLGAPATAKPPLGPNPFSGSSPTPPAPSRQVGPTGVTRDGQALLDDPWFQTQADKAVAGIATIHLKAHMELRFGPHDALDKSQVELLNAVRASNIRTFGWPIGITLDNRDEYRPRPYEDGIRAEVSISPEKSFAGRQSYDYWALRSNGDFYLLQSLFEDDRAENEIFFNTRIVRVTEALLFAANLYENLGAPPETRLSVRVTHRGLAGRQLTSSGSRPIFPATTEAEQAQAQIVVALGDIRSNLVDDVRRITAPMFMLFDFKEFSDSVYADIVRRFEKGDVS